MKVVLVAGDFSQSEALAMLAASLEEVGHQVLKYLESGKPHLYPIDAIKSALSGADWLVCGISELSAEEVTATQFAIENNIKVALYADTFNAHRLPAFEPVRNAPVTIFTINADEASDAQKLFPKATVIVTGNPRWESFFFPKMSRQEARQLLQIDEDKIVLLCVGDKYLTQNLIQFGATVDVVHSLGWDKNVEIIFALHPGDQNERTLYDEVVAYAQCGARILDRSIRSGDILMGCDFVVEFTSTIGIQAACLRIPMINFCSTVAMRGKKLDKVKGPWKLTEGGASRLARNGYIEEFAQVISDMQTEELGNHLKKMQSAMFPKPESNETSFAIQSMCHALASTK